MKKTDTERLKKIVSLWDALSSEIERRGITREMLLTEQFSQWAVTTPVYNIGEQVYQLSPEFKKEHPDIPWSVVSGLRHRLVHDYDGINWSLIADVIFDDMNPFVEQVSDPLLSILLVDNEVPACISLFDISDISPVMCFCIHLQTGLHHT